MSKRRNRAENRGHRRPLRAARLLPLPLLRERVHAAENPFPRGKRFRGNVRRGNDKEVAESFPAPLFLAAVQAFGVSGRTEGLRRRAFAARRLADAQRRRSRHVDRRAGRLTAFSRAFTKIFEG